MVGEFATYDGQRIKIGTCEDLYYLRADQWELVRNPDGPRDVYRFRFPFPDEDGIEPGRFDDHDRGVRIPGWQLPEDLTEGHYSIQFKAEPGYLLSVPCPEQFGQPGLRVDMPGMDGLVVHRNGFSGGAVVRQQRHYEGRLVTVVGCGSCGGKWRLPTLEHAQPVIDAFRSEMNRSEYRRDLDGFDFANSPDERAFLSAMAGRIADGYDAGEVV